MATVHPRSEEEEEKGDEESTCPQRKRLRRMTTPLPLPAAVAAAVAMPKKKRHVSFSTTIVYIPDIGAFEDTATPSLPSPTPVRDTPVLDAPSAFHLIGNGSPPRIDPLLYVPDLDALRARLKTTHEFLRKAVEAGLLDKETANLKQKAFRDVVKAELLVQLDGLGILWQRQQRLDVAVSRLKAQGLTANAIKAVQKMNEEDALDALTWARRV
jgi:hypothetical protein